MTRECFHVSRHQWGTGVWPNSDFAAASGVPCCPATLPMCAMCLCWCCVCLRLRTSTGQRTTTAPSIMALFQLVSTSSVETVRPISVEGWWYWHFGPVLLGFSWGAGSSAYQTEGAWDKDGKGLSIWDVFSHKKGKILQNDTGDSSCEGYHKVRVSWCRDVFWLKKCSRRSKQSFKFSLLQDDVSLIKELKLNHYRFSISWPRLIPTGIKCEYVTTGLFSLELASCSTPDLIYSRTCEWKGSAVLWLPDQSSAREQHHSYCYSLPLGSAASKEHFDRACFCVISKNQANTEKDYIVWCCSLFQVLQEKYGGWQNISMVNYFNEYANLCFERFGNRVKYWITFNNPWVCLELQSKYLPVNHW